MQAEREPVDDLLRFSEPYAGVELPIALDRLDLPALPHQCCYILLGSGRGLTETVAASELPGVVQLASRKEQPCNTEETLPGKCTRELPAGSRIRIKSPGGGGWGRPGS